MSSTRLFIGGLSDKVDRQELGGKLSQYAPVLSIDLKEKSDPEGNVLQRFAYANIDAAPSQVEECIQQLNGATWKGSRLRVERAKESFLDRLNRERAAKRQEQENNYSGKSDYSSFNSQRQNVPDTVGGLMHSEGHKGGPEQTNSVNVNQHSKKRKECNTSEENCLAPKKSKSLQASDETSHTEPYFSSKKKEKKKNEVEEKILSSFKQFSSVWADSDNENEEDSGFQGGPGDSCEKLHDGKAASKSDGSSRGTQNSHDRASHSADQNEDSDVTVDEDDGDDGISNQVDMREEQQTQFDILESLDDPRKCAFTAVGRKSAASDQVKGDDHTPPEQTALEHPTTEETVASDPPADSKYVKVSKDLTFGQNTSGFSLLAQFSKMNEEVAAEPEKESVEAAPVVFQKSLVTVHPKVKKRPFFISGSDREIDAAIKWMTQPITEQVIKEFEEALPDLRQVIRTRSFRAKKEEADPRMQRRGRGRGRGRGQGRGRAAGDNTGNPYRDQRWRERDIKK